MLTITIDYWLLILGALAGAGGALTGRGRRGLLKAAVVGAVLVFLGDLALTNF